MSAGACLVTLQEPVTPALSQNSRRRNELLIL
jgi:hypothetical protein